MAGKRRVSMPASILSTIPEVVVNQSDNNRNGSSSIFGPFLRKTSLFANKSPTNRRSSLVDTWAIRRGKNLIFVNILQIHKITKNSEHILAELGVGVQHCPYGVIYSTP